jgi:hypothetical protein
VNRSHHSVDISQQTAAASPEEDENPLQHPIIRAMRNIPALRYAKFLNDPVAAKQFLDGWEDNAQNGMEGRAKGATEAELALVRQAHPGDGEEGDNHYLDNPQAWNRMRKKL